MSISGDSNIFMDKQVQLFLFPFAGGNLFSFYRLQRFLDSRIDAVTVEYSGRGTRKDECYINDYSVFLNDIADYISERRNDNLPFATFGYSMGSVLSFDLCVNSMIKGSQIYAFFCAEGSVKKDNNAKKYILLNDNDFKRKILDLEGVNEKVLNNPVIFDEYMNLIRHDFDILAQYSYTNGVINVNSSIIYATDDVTCSSIDDWKSVISSRVDFYPFKGKHFFINYCYRDIAQIINKKLAEYF